ncbi:MAG: hypothetical protein NVS1B10_03550 [Candidatus Saccharimonadales bacterium]
MTNPHLLTSPEDLTIQAYIESISEKVGSAIETRLLPIRSVGVGGDERSHLSVVAIEKPSIGADVLARLAVDLPGKFRDTINRVIYALGDQPLLKCSLTRTSLGAEEKNQLRQADSIVFAAMRQTNLLTHIKQFPVVLLPLSFDKPGQRSIVLRPVTTSTFMTVQAMLPGRDLPDQFLANIAKQILTEVTGISQVFLDVTNKPPATTEWE